MTTSMEDLAKKFDGFNAALTKVLDKLSGLEAWKSTADVAMDKSSSPARSTRRRASIASSRLRPLRPSYLPSVRRRLRRNPHRGGSTRSTSTRLHIRRCAHLHRPGSGPAGTASPIITGMLAVGFWDPIRYTWSRVRPTIPTPKTMVLILSREIVSLDPALFPNLSFLGLMERTLDCGRTDARCISRFTM